MAFTGYPPRYLPKANLQQTLSSGSLSPYEVLSELQAVASTVNQLLEFVRAVITSDKKLKPAQIQGSVYTLAQEWTATAGQTEFLFSGGLTVDPTTATIAVYVGGGRIDPAGVTLSADRFALATGLTAGDVVVADIHENAESILALLASNATALGASLIGLEDAAGQYASSDVEGALEEVAASLAALDTSLGSVDEYLKRDGSVAWTGNQNAGSQRLTNMANGVNPQDAATVSQLTSATGGSYVRKTGDTMSGVLSMDANKITDLADATLGTDAMNKQSTLALALTAFTAGSTDTTKVFAPDGAGGVTLVPNGGGILRNYASLSVGSTPADLTLASDIQIIEGGSGDKTESHVPFSAEESNGSLITQELLRIAVGEAVAYGQIEVRGTLALKISSIALDAGASDVSFSFDDATSFINFTNGTETVTSYVNEDSPVGTVSIPVKSAGSDLYTVGDVIVFGVCPAKFFLDPVTVDTLFVADLQLGAPSFPYSTGANDIRGKLCLINAEVRIDKLS